LNEVVGDGRAARSPSTPEDVTIAVGAAEAVARLRSAGFRLLVVTNQPDVARGTMTRETALAITQRVVDALDLDDAYLCVHDNVDACNCRKPLPGLVLDAARDWNVALDPSWLIGDRWVDIAAARAAGVASVLLERPYSWDASGGVEAPTGVTPSVVRVDLAGAVDAVLSAGRRGEEDACGPEARPPQ
jgi:D-glycero-D-manno-heptose 1,7-bisphosphate phosphatase